MACRSSQIAHGIVSRLFQELNDKDSATKGLATRLQDMRKKGVDQGFVPWVFFAS